MNQWRLVAGVGVVALGSAAAWMWYEQSSQIVTTAAPTAAAAPLDRSRIPWAQQDIPVNQPPASAPAQDAPAAPAQSPAPTVEPTATLAAAAAEPPPDVDNAEPAQAKFTHGRRPESDQN